MFYLNRVFGILKEMHIIFRSFVLCVHRAFHANGMDLFGIFSDKINLEKKNNTHTKMLTVNRTFKFLA